MVHVPYVNCRSQSGGDDGSIAFTYDRMTGITGRLAMASGEQRRVQNRVP